EPVDDADAHQAHAGRLSGERPEECEVGADEEYPPQAREQLDQPVGAEPPNECADERDHAGDDEERDLREHQVDPERKRARSEAGTATVERPQAHPQTLQQLLGVRLRLLRKRLAHLRAGQHALEHLVELSTLEELLKRLLGLWTVEELLEDLLDLRLEHDDEPLRRRSDLLAAASCGPLDVRLEPRRP